MPFRGRTSPNDVLSPLRFDPGVCRSGEAGIPGRVRIDHLFGSLILKPRTRDYVIVGAGSAGCTLANRLSEDRDVSVLVLEAGGWDRDMWIHLPLGWGRLLQQRRHDWMYESEPVAGLAGRRIECARGKVVGGSSSINAMAYVRGNRADYDRWAAAGLTSGPTRTRCRISGGRSAGRAAPTPIAGATVRSRRKRRATRIRFAMPTWTPPAAPDCR